MRINHWTLPIAIVVFEFLPFCGVAIDVPQSPAGGEALDLRGIKNGYYYAVDKDDCFDNEFLKNGMTVEFWFYPARQTERGDAWRLIGKWTFYYLGMEHLYLNEENNNGKEFHAMRLKRGSIGGWGAWNFWNITDDGDYEPEWHHIVLQGRLFGNTFSNRVYQDKALRKTGSSSASPLVCDTDTPLFVGGGPEGTKGSVHDGSMLFTTVDLTTFDGLIDELRVSSTERYKQVGKWGKIDVEDRFVPDKNTVALWHFDEGHRESVYQDSSGNGHALFAGGELDVAPRDSIPTLWGAIKRQMK